MCKSGKNQTGRERDPLPVWTHTSKKTSKVEKKLFNSINWNNIYNANNIALKFHCFMNNIINIFNQSFPIESIKINYQNRNPWINKNLKKNEIKIRDKLYLLSKQIPTQANKDNYKKYKNCNLSNHRKAERNYYKEQFDLHKTDLKRSWKTIKT